MRSFKETQQLIENKINIGDLSDSFLKSRDFDKMSKSFKTYAEKKLMFVDFFDGELVFAVFANQNESSSITYNVMEADDGTQYFVLSNTLESNVNISEKDKVIPVYDGIASIKRVIDEIYNNSKYLKEFTVITSEEDDYQNPIEEKTFDNHKKAEAYLKKIAKVDGVSITAKDYAKETIEGRTLYFYRKWLID